jgi:hypothetical protein
MNRQLAACVLACLGACAIAGCAAAVASAPVAYMPLAPAAATPARVVRVESPVHIQLPTGYKRELAAGSRWRPVGRVPQGDVYRPVETVFTIEGKQVHEAYLVVADRLLVGFYLPAEVRYSALAAPLSISLGESR